MDNDREPSGDLVPYDPSSDNPVVPWTQSPVAYQTWDMTAPGGVDRRSKCLRKGDKALSELLGVVLTVEHIFCHLIEMTDEKSGEITRAMRTVFVLIDGGTVDCVSSGVLRSLGNLIAVYGPPPWPLGILVRAYETRSRRKFRVLCVEPVEGQM